MYPGLTTVMWEGQFPGNRIIKLLQKAGNMFTVLNGVL